MERLSTEQALVRISTEDMTDSDLHWLCKACISVYSNESPSGFLADIISGELTAYRLPSGILLAKFWRHQSGVEEMIVWALGGEGIVSGAKEIWAGLEREAALHGCRYIGGRSVTRGMNWVYERVLGMKPQATYYVKEVEK